MWVAWVVGAIRHDVLSDGVVVGPDGVVVLAAAANCLRRRLLLLWMLLLLLLLRLLLRLLRLLLLLWLLSGFWGWRRRVAEEGDGRLAREVGNGFTFGRETRLEGGRVAVIIRRISGSFWASVDVFRLDVELDLGRAIQALQRLPGLPLALDRQRVGILWFARPLWLGLYSRGLGNGILGFAALGSS